METDYRDYLQQMLADRKSGNSAYSLRAFARDLGINPATLPQVLNRKRGVSPKNAEKIVANVHLSPAEKARLSIAPREIELLIAHKAPHLAPSFSDREITFHLANRSY